MKFNALTIAISSLLLAGTAQAATVYEKDGNKLDITGFMKGMYYGSDNLGQEGDRSFARVNVKGWTELGGGWTAFGRLEKELSANQSEHFRHMHIGVMNDKFGTLTYGRQYGLFNSQVSNRTDVLVEFGNDGLGDGSDKFGSGRNSGLLTYVYNYGGLSLGVQATGAKSSDRLYGTNEFDVINTDTGALETVERDVKKESEEGYALSAAYEFSNGFGLSAAYNEAGKTDGQSSSANFGGDDDAKLAGAAMRYQGEALYAAVTLSKGESHQYVNGGFAEENTGLEAVVQYQVTPDVRLGVAYVQADVKDDGQNLDGTFNNYTSVEAKYNFKPNFHVFAAYKINLLDEDDADMFNGQNTDDVIAAGVEYAF